MLSTEEVSRVLMINERTVRKWIESKRIYAIKKSKKWLLSEKDVLYFISRNKKYQGGEERFKDYLKDTNRLFKITRKSWH